MEYRYYQSDAIKAIYTYFTTHKEGNPVCAMPTGTGKSIVIGGFIRDVVTAYPNQRIMMLTHVKELIAQNFDKLMRLWPTAPAGIYSAGLKRRDLAPIVYGGIASVAKSPELFGHVDLLLIDECHLVSPKSNTMYLQFIGALKKQNPYLRVIGFSATPFRLGQGMITDGGLFTDLCYNITGRQAFNRLISEGYIAPLIPKRTQTALDVSNVQIQGGEFVQSQLQHAVDKDSITFAALRELVANSAGRRSWLIFTTGIEHTEHVATMLRSAFGINALPVHSKMADVDRDNAIIGFKAGTVQCLVNNNVLTTGFDSDKIDLIGVLRPTCSPVLWVQMLGRGTRPGPGKTDCLVLDFAGNTPRLGPINDPIMPKKKGLRKGTAPVRLCEQCNTYNHASVRICVVCGYEFPQNVKFGAMAGTAELIAGDIPQVATFKVDRITYSAHRKIMKVPSMKVSYFCGLRMFQEWVCFEHTGYALHKSHDWWRERALTDPPETVDEALTQINGLKVPTHIRVWINRKNPEVMTYDFTGTAFSAEPSGGVPTPSANVLGTQGALPLPPTFLR